MSTDSVSSVLLSPFWESVDEQWIGGTLVVLSTLMFVSLALAIARGKSWRMYLTSMTLMVLASVMMVPFADARSPRELQHWLMLPQTLGTLTVLQILWIGITIFASIKEELNEKKQGFFYWVRLISIRLVTVIPSPVFLLFLIWIEQNILMNSQDVKPQIIGLQVAGVACLALTMLVVMSILLFSKFQLVGLHLLIGCLLVTACVLLPCLTEKLNWAGNARATQNVNEILILLTCGAILTLIGVFVPKKKIIGNK